MQGLLSIYFVRKSLRVTTINKELSLQYGDIILTKKQTYYAALHIMIVFMKL